MTSEVIRPSRFSFIPAPPTRGSRMSAVANYNSKDYPELEDFGEASLVTNNGASGYFRIDWFTPEGLGTWGDGRVIILGTKGYIELRKVLDVATTRKGAACLSRR